MKKDKIRKVLAAVSVAGMAAGLILAAGCKSSCSSGSCSKGSCSGNKGASSDTAPKSPAPDSK